MTKLKPTVSRRRFSSTFLLPLLLLCISLGGCDATENFLKPDRGGDMEIQDYRDGLASRVEDDSYVPVGGSSGSSEAPKLAAYVSDGYDDIYTMPIVSLSVNQSVPLRDVLYELAQQADYDIELDPSISGGIIFSAKERPLDHVISRICDMSGLRYTLNDSVLRIEVDRPYGKLYRIDFLSYVRTASGSINNDVNVVSGDGADTGSSFQTSTESEIDFWGELEANLDQIVGGDTVVLKGDVVSSAAAAAGGADAVVNVGALPVDGAGGGGQSESFGDQTFSVNRHAGIVSVFATQRVHSSVEEYLQAVKRSVTAQVLIEAKILEVRLTDESATGVDWAFLDLPGDLTDLSFLSTVDGTIADTLGSNSFGFGVVGSDFGLTIEALSQFGTVKGLASPRLTVLNNQSAVMNIADNRVFFEIDIEVEEADDDSTAGDEVTIDSEIRNVPVGVLMSVQPSINLEDRTIAISVRPTVTSTIGDGVEDPGVAFIAANNEINVSSVIPEINVQEIDTVIKVNSGDAIVMGGLIQDSTSVTERGVPILSEIPLFGAAFRSRVDEIAKVELVIFLRATIIDEAVDTISSTDMEMYRRFSEDRRPLKF